MACHTNYLIERIGNKVNKCIFITVRTGSTRLPKKALINICGMPTIQYLINNLKQSKYAKEIVLCTTLDKSDDTLCSIAKDSGIKYFRGSMEDKLLRWEGACNAYGVDFFVNADGDDLFFDYGLADSVFEQYESSGADFIDGRGLYNDVYGISSKGLKLVCHDKKNSDTEFIKLYFDKIEHLIKAEKITDFPLKYKKRQIRMTLDYPEDLLFFSTIIEHHYKNNLSLDFDSILSYIGENPDVVQINWNREQNWKDNQDKMINKVMKEGI